MNFNSFVAALAFVVANTACIAQPNKSAPPDFSGIYRHIDIAASQRNVQDYMAYDAPNFVTGIRGHLSRSQAANIIRTQMKSALWFKSKTTIRTVIVQRQNARLKTQMHQQFLSAYRMADGSRESFVFDLVNLDTWRKQNKQWKRVSSIPLVAKITKNGKMIVNK